MSKVRLISETELPTPQSESAQADPPPTPKPSETERPSAPSLPASRESPNPVKVRPPELLEMLETIMKILNVRMSAALAMAGAFCLTAAAMVQGTYMSLAISLSFDLCVFLPLAWIAYRAKKD